jgi:N-acyl-D-amino-acid deacylase
MRSALKYSFLLCALCAGLSAKADFDIVIRHGSIYNGSGQAPFTADIAVKGDRIVAIAPSIGERGRREIDATGKAVAPGFINMLAHPEESFFADGRALSDLAQGVTLEVIGEDSMGPLTPEMKKNLVARQGDIHYPVTWTTLGQYLSVLETRGISPNVASFVGEGTVRTNLLGENNVAPTPEQLKKMRALVKQAMEEGAVGLTTALIYAPNTYANTDELIEMAKVSAQCGGIYSAHMRNEGDRMLEAIDETIAIAKASGAPAEIYHFKLAGRDNWDKLDAAVARIEAARQAGIRISADMYTYTAGATGLDAAMPKWVQDGGLEKWIERLKDPQIRARVITEMKDLHAKDWDNLFAAAGPDGVLFLGFKNPALKPLTGKTLTEVAKMRGTSPEDTAIDLVIEDGSRVGVAYFLMNEKNILRQVALPWMSFDSDEEGAAPEGVFLLSKNHPRAYGSFVRVLGHYARDEKALDLADGVRRLSAFPARMLSLQDRGMLAPGYFADIVIFDPATVIDHATYAEPAQLATGVQTVIVNGGVAIDNGVATGAKTGRAVRGRAWTGVKGGGCRAKAEDWQWAW